MKIYHDQSYAVKLDDIHGDVAEWTERSSFSEVFFDFDDATKFLICKFNRLLKEIYSGDIRFASDPPDYGNIEKCDKY